MLGGGGVGGGEEKEEEDDDDDDLITNCAMAYLHIFIYVVMPHDDDRIIILTHRELMT
jgi:hypothetical protein